MDAAEYKHVVLGLIFLKYISDAFEEKHAALVADKKSGADPEDPDEYRADNIFWVPKEARWAHLQGKAKQPMIGKLLDDAMVAIERDNPTLKGVSAEGLRPPVARQARLGELIDLIGTIGLGDRHNRSRDVLGRVYEYFLTRFASAEGKNGGQFYTPRCVVRECWSRCSLPTRAGCSTRAAGRAGCSCRARSSSRPTAGASAT
jgi:type I restriction enzyme M protein